MTRNRRPTDNEIDNIREMDAEDLATQYGWEGMVEIAPFFFVPIEEGDTAESGLELMLAMAILDAINDPDSEFNRPAEN